MLRSPRLRPSAGSAVVRLVVVRGLAELLQAEPGRYRTGQRPVARVSVRSVGGRAALGVGAILGRWLRVGLGLVRVVVRAAHDPPPGPERRSRPRSEERRAGK